MRIISRQEWGARPRKNTPVYCPHKQGIIIHHTYMPGNGIFSTPQNMQLQRGMQDYHMTSAGGVDIFQGFTVFQNGDVMEGRAGGIFTDNGAAKTWFEEYVGIENQGNFEIIPPPRPLLRSLLDLLEHICKQGVPPILRGHYQMPNNATSCPGRYMKEQMPKLQAELISRLNQPEEEDDMGKLLIPAYAGGEFKSPEGMYVYNIPSCYKEWWLDLTNEYAEPVLVKIFANAQLKTDTWGLWYTEMHVPSMSSTEAGKHFMLVNAPWLSGKENILPDFLAVSIHAEKPIMVMVGP